MKQRLLCLCLRMCLLPGSTVGLWTIDRLLLVLVRLLLQGSPGTSKAPAAAKGASGGAAAAATTGTATAAAGASTSAAEAAAAAAAAGISAGGLLRPTGPNVRAADWAWLAMLCWKVQDNLTSTFLQALKSGDRMQQRTAVGIMSNLSEVSAGDSREGRNSKAVTLLLS
jgi:hypothetical protein